MDYRRFLAKREELVAPVVERRLWLHDRSLVVDGVAAGWWRARVRGRDVEPLRPAIDDEVAAALSSLPMVRGPVLRAGGGWAAVVGGGCEPIDLMRSDEEPQLFATLKARRWPLGGLLLWDEVDWEGEEVDAARKALEEGQGLSAVKGASAALRAAFAFATAAAASRALGIAATAAELRRWVRDIAERGRPAAEAALRALAVERAAFLAGAATRRALVECAQVSDGAVGQRDGRHEARLEATLRAAGARLLGHRRASAGLIEVRWELDGERFISIVEERGLRVVDAGVCLDGSDSLVTLDSLPGVIRQAMHEEALVITRHGWE